MEGKKEKIRKKRELTVGRIVVNLDRDEYEFVDKIGRDTLFTTGKRLTNNKILRVFVRVMKELDVEGKGVRNSEELTKRIYRILGISKGERRKYSRFKEGVSLSWRELDSMREYEMAKTINIGEGGFRVDLKEERKIGDNLEFTIIDPNMTDKPIKALGKVIWVKKDREKGTIETGVKLTYLAEEEKDRFRSLFQKAISVSR